jgi:hypothetical protein
MDNISEIVFDENLFMECTVEGQIEPISLALSDGLNAATEILSDQYKMQIINFLNKSLLWLPIATEAVNKWGMETYSQIANEIELVTVYIRFEQNDPPQFGLEFRPDYDIEHGCGMKISGNNFDVWKLGSADVAFC